MRLKIIIFLCGLVVGYVLYASYIQWQYFPEYKPDSTQGNYAVADVSFCYKSYNEAERQIVSMVDLKTKTGYMRFKDVDICLHFYDSNDRLVFSSHMHPTEVDTRYVSYTSTFTLLEETLLSDVHRYRLSVACSYSYGIWGVCDEMWYTKGTISDENTNNVHEEESMNLQEREEKSVGI